MELEIRDDRQMRALTGVPMEKLEVLEAAFAKAFVEEKELGLTQDAFERRVI